MRFRSTRLANESAIQERVRTRTGFLEFFTDHLGCRRFGLSEDTIAIMIVDNLEKIRFTLMMNPALVRL